MALNFPNTGLTEGLEYTGDNGVTYVYDGEKWVGRAPAGNAGTNSIINGDKVVQVDGDGNLVIPVGSIIKDSAGNPILVGAVEIRSVNFPLGEEGDKRGTIADIDDGVLYYCSADWTGPNEPQGYSVEASENYDKSQSINGTDMVLTVAKGQLPLLDDMLNNLSLPNSADWQLSQGNATDGYVRDCVAAEDDSGNNWTFTWQYVSGQDSTSFSQNDQFELTYTQPQAAIWEVVGTQGLTGTIGFTPTQEGQVKYSLDINGDIKLRTYLGGTDPNDMGPAISLGNSINDKHRSGVVAIGNDDVGYNSKPGGVYIGAEAGWNDAEVPQGEYAIAIGAYAARNFAEDNSITLNATGEHFDPTADGLYIKPIREVVENTAKALYYDTTTGEITYADPTGGTAGDANIWIQDFETTEGAPADVVGMASSVEYLANGDIIALFVHYVEDNGQSRYSGVARFSPTGTQLWSMRFQGSQYTDGWGLAVDNDGGFIYVAGQSSGSTPYEQATLTKLTQADGTIVWSKYYDVGYDNTNTVVDVASDGNPVVVGYANNGTDTQIVTTKISSVDGSIIWSKALNGQGYDEAYGMAVGPSGEVVTVGYIDALVSTLTDSVATAVTEPVSNANWTVSHVNVFTNGVNFDVDITAGVPTITIHSDDQGGWTVGETIGTLLGSTFGGTDGIDDMVVKVATTVTDDKNRILVAKYASDGSIAWQKAVTPDAGFDCSGADADIDGDGNIYVCGNFSIDNGSPWLTGIIIIKFNSSGVKQWTRKVQGNCQDVGTSIVVGPDNCLYLSAVTGNNNGPTDYSMVVAKYNLDGTVAWQRMLDNTTTWTFAGGSFFGPGGSGSTLAVRTGYVAVSGGFGDPDGTVPHAVLAQFDSEGTVFSVGNYDFKAASFSGLLNGSASDITVFNANKDSFDYSNAFDVFDFEPGYDADIIVGTLYSNVVSDADLIGNGAADKIGYKYTVYTDSSNYQGGEDNPGVILKDNPDHPYTVGDLITFRNGEQRTITSVQTGYSDTWVQWSGPVAGSDENPRFPITVQSSNYAPETKPTARIKPDLTEANAHDQYMKIYAGSPGPTPTDPGTPPLVDSLHIHMAGAQENVELFLGTDANYVSTKETGDTPAGVRLHSEVDVAVVDTDLRLDRKGSTWVSVYGDGENVNLHNSTYDLSWSTIAVDDHGDYYVGGEANQWAEAIINKYSRDGQLLWSKYNNGDSYNGWQFDGVAYHNNQIATLIQTNTGHEYNYYKLSVLDSNNGELISTTDIYDPDGRLEAHNMIHHSTLGWTVVGHTRGEVATTGPITDINNPNNYDAIRLLASDCQLDGVYPTNGSGWVITGTNITSGQNLNSGIGYFQNVPVVAVTGTGVDATANVYIDYNNGYYGMDWVTAPGSGYANGDIVKISGSQLGGVDGGQILFASPSAWGDEFFFAQSEYPTLDTTLNAVSGGAFARLTGNDAIGRVTAVRDVGDGNWGVAITMTRGENINSQVSFFAGNDMTFTCYSDGGLNSYSNYDGIPSLEYIWIDMNVAGGYIDTAFKDGTFTLTRQRQNRPWIWTNEWTRFLNPVPDVNNGYASGQAYCVAEDPVTQDLVVGGYIDTPSHSGTLVWKLNDAGVTQWAKTIDGDDNNVSGIAVSSIDSSIYVGTNYAYVHKLSSDSTLIKTVGSYGPWGVSRPEVKLAIEEDGFEYVYVGGQGGSMWGNSNGFYLSKLTTDLATVWGRNLDHFDDQLNCDYDIEHTKFVLGKGQASMVGFGYQYSNNSTNALIYTISTGDNFEPVNIQGWRTAQNGYHSWNTDTGLSMYDIIAATAQATTATTLTLISADELAWTNYAFQSRLLNLNSEQRGIVGVETIEFADGGTLDHNPADIPPSQWFDPDNQGWEYTLQLSDRGRFILNQTIPNDSNCQDLYVYVPRNDQVAFPVGTVITLINASSAEAGGQNIYVRPINYADGNGWVRIWAVGGGQNSSQWRFQGIQTATLMKISTNAWLLTANNIINDD